MSLLLFLFLTSHHRDNTIIARGVEEVEELGEINSWTDELDRFHVWPVIPRQLFLILEVDVVVNVGRLGSPRSDVWRVLLSQFKKQ